MSAKSFGVGAGGRVSCRGWAGDHGNRGSSQAIGCTPAPAQDSKKVYRYRAQLAKSGFTSASTNTIGGRSTKDRSSSTTLEALFTPTFAGGKLWTFLAGRSTL